ncbi:MAG: NPCBM/NEW2 domain-containing protein [Phycisphaerales bacterium]|nr:NPCBM/NEW2 domain-containing protein [Phycisphaerales bacterium]
MGRGTAADGDERSVRAVRLDGTTVTGQWMGATEVGEFQFRSADGVVVVPTDDLSSVVFGATAKPSGDAVVFYLADGGRLRGAIAGGASDAVVGRTALGDSVTIGWDKLAGIQLANEGQFRRSDQLFREALSDRLPSQDVLISRDSVEVKKLNGRLESLDAEGGSFVFAGEPRKFQNDRIFGIVFATGAREAPVFPMSVELADGSVFSGTLERADADTMRVATSVGAAVDVPIADVAKVWFRSDRLVHVGDLKPVGERVEGIVHAGWPVQRDRSVSGSPLSICGRKFERGLGVHSRTELSYAINGEFERLAATIGIDDAVRPLGSVVMRVAGDSKVLFDSGEIGGTDGARDVIVDVAGVKTLTLTVDYGEGLDVSDQADWGDVRLIRPRGGKGGGAVRKP